MHLALRRIEENKKTKNPYLDLSFCSLHYEVPHELGDCYWLKGIALGAFNGMGGKEPDWLTPRYNRRGNQNKLTGNELMNFKFLNLKEVYCYGIGLQNIEFLEYSSQLTKVDLDENNIASLVPLYRSRFLKYLSIRNNRIKYIGALIDITSLEELDLYGNEIQELDNLKDLNALEKLCVSKNNITNISALGGLTQLKVLNLYQNQITNVNPLSKLSNLKSLGLANNKIRSIGSLANLKQLKSLYVRNNEITSLDQELLQMFENLEQLSISGNPIAGYSEDRLKRLENRVSKKSKTASGDTSITGTLFFIGMTLFGVLVGGVVAHGNIIGLIMGGLLGPTMVFVLMSIFLGNPKRR